MGRSDHRRRSQRAHGGRVPRTRWSLRRSPRAPSRDRRCSCYRGTHPRLQVLPMQLSPEPPSPFRHPVIHIYIYICVYKCLLACAHIFVVDLNRFSVRFSYLLCRRRNNAFWILILWRLNLQGVRASATRNEAAEEESVIVYALFGWTLSSLRSG